MKRDSRIFSPAPAHLAWIGAMLAFILLLLIDVRLSVIPLVLFLFITFTAPFIPWFPYFLPVVSRGRTGKRSVSLTFDDGPDQRSTIPLLDLLDRHGVRATFFMTGKNAEANSELVRLVLGRGHLVGNHSYSHDIFLVLKGPEAVKSEIARAQNVFRNFGIVPAAFRPPVGITSPRLRRPLLELGMYCVTFRRRAADFGNKRIGKLCSRVLKKVRPDDIILLHDVYPGSSERMNEWLDEVDKIIAGLRDRGYLIIPLDRLCMRPVMNPVGRNPGSDGQLSG